MLVGSKITVPVRFSLSHILSWSKTTGTASKLLKKPSHDRKLLPLEYRLRMLIVKTLLLPPSLNCALGRWVKDVLKNRDWLPPRKLRRSNFITQSTMRGGHVYCVCKKAIRSFNIDLHTWWWKWLQEARGVHLPQRLWIFEEIPAVLFKVSRSKARWRPPGHH